jgi:hypothetical protein
MSSLTLNYGEREIMLTTESSASSYGIPVLIVSGVAYGPKDMMPEGCGELGWLDKMETAEQAVTVAARNAGFRDHPAVRAFLDQ